MDAPYGTSRAEPERAAPDFGRREPTAREWNSVVHEEPEPSGGSHALLYSLVAVVALAAGFGAYTYFGVGRTNPGPFPNVPHKVRRVPTTSTPPVPSAGVAIVTSSPAPALAVKASPTAAITLKPAAT